MSQDKTIIRHNRIENIKHEIMIKLCIHDQIRITLMGSPMQ